MSENKRKICKVCIQETKDKDPVCKRTLSLVDYRITKYPLSGIIQPKSRSLESAHTDRSKRVTLPLPPFPQVERGGAEGEGGYQGPRGDEIDQHLCHLRTARQLRGIPMAHCHCWRWRCCRLGHWHWLPGGIELARGLEARS